MVLLEYLCGMALIQHSHLKYRREPLLNSIKNKASLGIGVRLKIGSFTLRMIKEYYVFFILGRKAQRNVHPSHCVEDTTIILKIVIVDLQGFF